MRPTLDPTGHRVPRTKPTCLLHTWRPHRRRPFSLVLHLHQHQSSCNLHLQYLAKNQSTQRCQSLITQGSDHPPVIEPHMVLTVAASWKMAMQPDVKALPDLASGEHGGRLAPPPDRHHHLHHLSIEIGREMRDRGKRGRAPPEGEVAPHRGSPHRGSAEAAAGKTSSSRPRRGRWPRSRTSRCHLVKIYPTTQTLHLRSSISAMLTSLLPLEGFYDFQK
jgi:hypothetical protein